MALAGPRREPPGDRWQPGDPRKKPRGDKWQPGERMYSELYKPSVNEEKWDKGSNAGPRRPNEDAFGKKRADWVLDNERLRGTDEMRTVVYDNIEGGKKSSRRKFAKARVEDMTAEIDREASRLRTMYKRPRFGWKEVMQDDLRTAKISGDQPAIGNGEVWLSKFLSHCGACSRRNVTELVLQGRVSVNGEIVQEPALKVNPQKDTVALDGQVRKLRTLDEMIWIMINKPKNTISSMQDEEGRNCVTDLVPFAKKRRLVPVGRLDRNARGLMLLTNDYEWHSILTHPRHEMPKRYNVMVWNGEPSQEKLQALEQGIMLPDERKPLLPLTDLRVLERDKDTGSCNLTFQTTEGKYHFIQRMFEWIGHPVKAIKRTGFGELKMDRSLKDGEWRILTPKEIRRLKGPTILKRPRPPPEQSQSELLDAVRGGQDKESDRRGVSRRDRSQGWENNNSRPSRRGSTQEWEQDSDRTLRSDRSQSWSQDGDQPWRREESDQWDDDNRRSPRRSQQQDSDRRPAEKPEEDWEASWIKQLDQMQMDNAPGRGVR